MNKSYLVATVIVVIALGFTAWAFSSSMTPYVTIQIARQSDTPVQVKGIILRDTPDVPNPRYDSDMKALCFWIEDKNHERIEVQFHGAKPEAFDTAPETAATGIIRKDAKNPARDVLVSDSMVVKCPSKYDDHKSPYQEKKTATTKALDIPATSTLAVRNAALPSTSAGGK